MTAQEIVEEITERIEANKAVKDEYKAEGEYIKEALRESAILELIGLRAFIVGRTEANVTAERNRREADEIAEREQFFREITPEEVEQLRKETVR